MEIRKKWTFALLPVLVCVIVILLFSQKPSLALGEFVDSGISFLGLHYSGADWGDYDSDGDLDLAIVGEAGSTPSFRLYVNQSNNSFVEIATGIPGRTYANVGWVDYNNDGQLDLLVGGSLTGYGPGGITTLYQNDAGILIAVPNTPFAPVSYPAFDWADYDGDGDLDLLLAGRIDVNNGTNVTHIYRNDGNNTFTTMPTNLAGIAWGVVAWIDYDNDDHIDIFLTGCPDGNSCISASTKLYHNNNDGTWSEVSTPFTQVGRSGADWGDYDNDGDLDVIILGSYLPGRLYRNIGNGTFQDTGLSFPALSQAMVQWGDYDNDGFLDVALAGLDSQVNSRTHIYHNNGNGTFTDIMAGIGGVASGALAWGDYDNNGRFDLLVSGCDRVYCTGYTRLYRNTLAPQLPFAIKYLPVIFNSEISFPLAINTESISSRSIIHIGEVFYSTTISIPSSLPMGGIFYLSASPSTLEPTIVDDKVVFQANGTAIFSHDYSTSGDPTPAVVQVPRSVLESVAGQPVTVEFVDVYGVLVSASPMYLIWQP